MRVVYMGTAPFAVPALRRIAPHVSLVVSQPDRPAGRGMRLQPSPVSQVAEELGIPTFKPERCRGEEVVARLKAEDADIFLVAAYGQILRPAILDLPRHGCFNLHGSVLPRWRGAAPIQRAVMAGDTYSGVTVIKMDAGMDTGPVVTHQMVGIGPLETAGELYARLAELAGDIAESWLPILASGNAILTPQPEDGATHAAKMTPEDGQLKPDQEITELFDRYRACTPAPGAWMETPYGRLKVRRALPMHGALAEPGTVVSVRPALVVAVADGGLVLSEVQPEGRKAQSGVDFANGAHIEPGMRLF